MLNYLHCDLCLQFKNFMNLSHQYGIKKNLIQPILLRKLHSKVIENPLNTIADFVKIQNFYPSKGE